MKGFQKEAQKKIALERISQLFEQAARNPVMANRYVALARKIQTKCKARMPSSLKRKFCKHCLAYFRQGNYRVRTRNGIVVYTCLACKKLTRVRYK